MEVYKYSELTEAIINAAYTVHNALGYGFLEKVYHRALIVELMNRGLPVDSEKRVEVTYGGQVVGEYFADIVVDGKVVIEVKSSAKLGPEAKAQLLNYLKAGHIEVGLLINFASSVRVNRLVL